VWQNGDVNICSAATEKKGGGEGKYGKKADATFPLLFPLSPALPQSANIFANRLSTRGGDDN
jgi:hypothetical protein